MSSDFHEPPPHQPAPINPYDNVEPPRPGMSSGAKVLLGLGIGCGVLLLVCCGGFGIFVFYFGRSVQNAVSEDPATIRRVTESIVAIEVPEKLEPRFSLDWTIPFVGISIWATGYNDGPNGSQLFLFQLEKGVGNAEAMKQQFQQSVRDAGQAEWREVDLEDPETVEVEIDGAPAEFVVGKGKRRGSDQEVWQATGAFEGKGGPAMLLMQLRAEDFDKDQVMAVLHSMK